MFYAWWFQAKWGSHLVPACTSMASKNFLKSRSLPSEYHRASHLSFSVHHQITILLPSIMQCSMLFQWIHHDSTPFRKSCAPPLNPTLHRHCCGPYFTTTGIMVDNWPTPWIYHTYNVAKASKMKFLNFHQRSFTLPKSLVGGRQPHTCTVYTWTEIDSAHAQTRLTLPTSPAYLQNAVVSLRIACTSAACACVRPSCVTLFQKRYKVYVY